MWIGLKCKNTSDGLKGRPLICTKNRGTRKIPQVIKQNIVTYKNWQQLCTYTTSVNFPCCWWQPSFNFSSKKKKTKKQYKCNRWFYVICISSACKSSSVFFKIFLYVVLDVGLCYFNVPVKSKLNHPPWAFELLASYWVFKFPPPGIKSHSNTPFYVRFRWSNSPT